ncbi:MAG: SRPBCC family protein, partial [Gammaproteobacteria bacterium]
MFGSKRDNRRWLLPPAIFVFCLLCVTQTAAGATFYKLDVTRHGDRYEVIADVHLDAAPADVYSALLDFKHFPEINPSVRISRLVRQVNVHTQLVYIETVGCVAIFCQTIRQLQQFTELDPQDIVAVTLPDGSNVKQGTSSWHLEPEGDGTRLRWQASLEPDFWVPPFVGPRIIARQLREQAFASMRDIECQSLQHWA